MTEHKVETSKALQFILAGNALFTVRSLKTGVRFTFKVQEHKETAGLFFVKVLCGTDNENDYRMIGKIRNNEFSLTQKAREAGLSYDTPSVIAFGWVLRNLIAKNDNFGVEIWHEGRCGRCGRTLTVPESIELGLGPECATRGM
jgi:hypothetical protein